MKGKVHSLPSAHVTSYVESAQFTVCRFYTAILLREAEKENKKAFVEAAEE